MAEKDFQTEILRGCDHFGFHAYKIPDMPYALAKLANYKEKKPYDCYMVCGGFHAMELKQVAKGLTFTLSHLQDHQEEALLRVERNGQAGWLIVNFRSRLTEAAKKKRKTNCDVVDRAFGARIQWVVDARIKEARTGLGLEWWEAHAVELPQMETSAGLAAWDPRPLQQWLETWG